jgi:hypothetical protein
LTQGVQGFVGGLRQLKSESVEVGGCFEASQLRRPDPPSSVVADRAAGPAAQFVEADAVRELDQLQAVGRDVEYAEVGDDTVDDVPGRMPVS